MTLGIKENRDNYWKELLQYPLFDDGFFNRNYMKKDSNYKSLALSRRKSDSLFNSDDLSLNFKFDARRIGDKLPKHALDSFHLSDDELRRISVVSPKAYYLSVELTLHSKNDDKIPIYDYLKQRQTSIENQLDLLKNEFNAIFCWDRKFKHQSRPANNSLEEYSTCVSGIQLCKFDLDLQDATNFEEACEFHSKCMPEFKSVLESELKSILD